MFLTTHIILKLKSLGEFVLFSTLRPIHQKCYRNENISNSVNEY